MSERTTVTIEIDTRDESPAGMLFVTALRSITFKKGDAVRVGVLAHNLVRLRWGSDWVDLTFEYSHHVWEFQKWCLKHNVGFHDSHRMEAENYYQRKLVFSDVDVVVKGLPS